MLLAMSPTPEVRRRVLLLLAGIVGLAVVIGLCVVALVVLLDRFTAKAGRDCAATHCRSAPASTSTATAWLPPLG